MKKLIMTLAMALSAVVITGCESKQEALVKELYSAVQSADFEVADKFAKEHFEKGVENLLNSREGREVVGNVKAEFGKIHDSKEAPQIKVLKEGEHEGTKFSAIEAKCAGTTLYYVVAGEKIQVITTKYDMLTFK